MDSGNSSSSSSIRPQNETTLPGPAVPGAIPNTEPRCLSCGDNDMDFAWVKDDTFWGFCCYPYQRCYYNWSVANDQTPNGVYRKATLELPLEEMRCTPFRMVQSSAAEIRRVYGGVLQRRRVWRTRNNHVLGLFEGVYHSTWRYPDGRLTTSTHLECGMCIGLGPYDQPLLAKSLLSRPVVAGAGKEDRPSVGSPAKAMRRQTGTIVAREEAEGTASVERDDDPRPTTSAPEDVPTRRGPSTPEPEPEDDDRGPSAEDAESPPLSPVPSPLHPAVEQVVDDVLRSMSVARALFDALDRAAARKREEGLLPAGQDEEPRPVQVVNPLRPGGPGDQDL
uniref:uncharacterized protein LOC131129669 n=1 Tax=Doryrhamphus excisus TaxID=161450 RepID=UPI0025AEA5C9|nr:uncharacterized protein LOC131129669 [Doryrhamphus excisus]